MDEQATTAVTVIEPGISAISVRQLTDQVKLIQDVMRAVMKNGEHYGVIPGTGGKPTLLKPGAEKLCLTFRFAPEYEPTSHTTLREDFILWDIRCKLIHIQSGQLVGTGMGSCSSREEKYGWRNAQRICPACGKEAIIKGKADYGGGWICFEKKGGCKAKFKDGDPAIESQVVGKTPNPNIWDLNNTIEKMACKRALVAAVLNATAASDIFTQDMEDMPTQGPVPAQEATNAPQPVPGPAQETKPPQTGVPDPPKVIGEDRAVKLHDYLTSQGFAGPHILNTAKKYHQVDALADLTEEAAKALVQRMKEKHDQQKTAKPKPPLEMTHEPPQARGDSEDQAYKAAKDLEVDIGLGDVDIADTIQTMLKHSVFDGDAGVLVAIRDAGDNRDALIDVARTMRDALVGRPDPVTA